MEQGTRSRSRGLGWLLGCVGVAWLVLLPFASCTCTAVCRSDSDCQAPAYCALAKCISSLEVGADASPRDAAPTDGACAAPKVWYKDGDKDGFGDPNQKVLSCDGPQGYVLKGGDCDDANPDAFPGQRRYFTKPRANRSFDYNCDGKSERQFTRQGQCRNGCQIQTGFTGDIPSCGRSGRFLSGCRRDGDDCDRRTQNAAQACR